MANKLNVNGFAIATAVLTAIVYIACFLIVISFGDSSLKFFNLFFHGIDLTSLKSNPNITNGIIGLVISVIVSYITGWIFAITYNKYTK